MRIGIVTQPLEMNYGGILQNWALQQALRHLGHEPITIDAYERYSTPHYFYNCMQAVISCLRRGKKISLPKRYRGSLRRPHTGEFVERNIAKTYVMWDYQRSVVRRYGLDAMVVGSDQVWRSKYNGGHLEDMYLKFAEGLPLRRVAYAASFGVDEWEYSAAQTEACARLAQQMDAISVREASGIDLCRDYLGVDAQRVLDPTMLLKPADYEGLISNELAQAKDEQNYLGVYCLDVTQKKMAFFERLACDRGLTVHYFAGGWYAAETVEQWLLMFNRASMMVTDSFHGTVFSILFGKEFYTLGNPKRGNTRIMGLLEQFGLEQHLISDTEPVEPKHHDIDWADVNARLAQKRKESLDFLSKSLIE